MWALLAYICLPLPIYAACNTILVPKSEPSFLYTCVWWTASHQLFSGSQTWWKLGSFQGLISKLLHHHTFFNIVFNESCTNVHQAHILLFLGLGIWTKCIFPMFYLSTHYLFYYCLNQATWRPRHVWEVSFRGGRKVLLPQLFMCSCMQLFRV